MKRLIVIGTSSGGIDALATLFGGLPADFQAPIAVVMHTAAESPGFLPEILGRHGPLPVAHAKGGERLESGRIYIAPPDRHLLVEPGRVCLSRGPRENRFRPAIDPLFRSAAQVYGPAAIGVILTGNLDDGTAGLRAIKQLGGTAVVQDPADARYASMPANALARVAVDYTVPLARIPGLLVELTSAGVPVAAAGAAPARVDIENRIAREEDPLAAGVERLGPPSPLACPECHGVLREWQEDGQIRFRCHTGHAYSAASLAAEVDEGIEVAVWNAIRALQEGSILLRQFGGVHDAGQLREGAAALEERANELERQANVLRGMVTGSAAK